MSSSKEHAGSCSCGYVQYNVTSSPLVVHCCHCSYCQKQTGSAFVLNALYEAERVQLTQGEVKEIVTPSPSGKGQTIARCPICHVAVWSNYYMGGLRERIRFVRVGTLDNPSEFPPDVHIFTETTVPWFKFPEGQVVVDEFYAIEDVYSEESLARRDVYLNEFKQSQAAE